MVTNPTPIWTQMLNKGAGANLDNTSLVLALDPDYADLFWYDEMQCRPIMSRVDKGALDPIKLVMMQQVLQRKTKVLKRLSQHTLLDAILLVSQDHRFHPIKEELEAVPWDGTPRASSLLPTYFGTEDNEYYRCISSCFLVAMIARIYQPGVKMDYMLVLEGPQGELKSTACRILAGDEYFSDTMPDLALDPVRCSQHLPGKWLVEISELSAIARAEPHRLKSFISTQVEQYTPKFGRVEVSEPRQCVFVGTTNDDRYLRDDTGGRRFWPAKCGKIDLEGLRRDRLQILAEAKDAYDHGAHHWPDRDFELRYIKPIQDSRYQSDAWEDEVQAYAPHVLTRGITLTDLAKNALEFDKTARFGTADQRRLISVLNRLGWTRGKKQSWGQPWLPPPPP